MSTINNQKQAAKQFVQEWSGKGYEKGETQRFWMALLHDVLGVDNPVKAMEFEIPVKTITKEKGSDFIDGYITATKVLIEQKGSHVDLSAKYRQSDGQELTPYQQARRYAAGLPLSMAPRWIVACNFTSFEVHDMEHPNDVPEIIQLADLEKEYTRLTFLVDDTNVHLKKELEVSIQAGEIVGVLYDKILSQYRNPEDPETQKALNKLCVRLVFCLYAEDAGIFGSKNMFHDYMEQFPASMFREQLIKLFRILDQKPEERDPYEDEKLLAFPYVNGGMFAGDIEIPRINEDIRALILQRASDDFDWSLISPTIFGAVFESTLNPETRRAGGMHYTSIENIHKVIDPLFLDDLKAELADIKATTVARTKKERAYAFQDKLASLKFFDPACGSGNFLTESYTSLRRLENEALRIIYGGDRVIGEMADPIKVSINQFYGIEINDFACSVAQTALWIAESQMMAATDEIVGFNLDPLPLKTYTNIHEGNALRMDWNEVVAPEELDYIMGNPPFVSQGGASDKGQRKGVSKSEEQKEDQLRIFKGIEDAGNLDYVACWHWLSYEYMKGNPAIEAAFVSTNSICQGQQVKPLWKNLFNRGIVINFAHQSFLWRNEAHDSATVYCVIIGFSFTERKKRLYSYDNYRQVKECREVGHINGYLFDSEDFFVEKRSTPFADVPEMSKGFQPTDNGYLLLSAKEKKEMVAKDPGAERWIRPFSMGEDFIKGTERYCLWLQGISPAQLDEHPGIRSRVTCCRQWRSEQSPSGDAFKLKDIPHLLRPCGKFIDGTYIGIPVVTSGARKYVPFGFLTNGTIPGNKLYFIPTDSLYVFGVMTSIVQNAWMRVVAGRFGPSYNYANTLVYNTFPWPNVKDSQRLRIEETAQKILEARALFPDSSLAQLYDDDKMPVELRKAHRANDAAVLEAYGFPKDATESDIVARLFKMYQELVHAI